MLRHSLLLLLAFALASCSSLNTSTSRFEIDPDTEVHGHTLDNGLKVLVKEIDRAPVVVSQIWYKVGSSYEYDGITGVSHALEHMMFKGTEKHPAGEFSEIISAKGGSENAFTSRDYTAYFQRIANHELEFLLMMEADRMRNLVLKEEDFLKELEVVKEERRLRTDDQPTALTWERFNAVAWTNNPYRQPIIGWMEDLDTMTIDDMRYWYQKWYAPNNATLVVAGDVKAEEVFSLAEKYFAELEPSDIVALKPRREAKQLGKREVTVELPAKLPFVIMGYKVPSLKTADEEWEVYALEVLAGILDGGSSARLSRDLVRGEELATSAGASYNLAIRHETMLSLSAIPAKTVSIETLRTALEQQIETLKTELASQSELDRVIAQVLAGSVYEQDSSFYQAMEIGVLETVGIGWEKKDDYIPAISKVTAEQVRKVAQKYLVERNLTVATLVPQAIETAVETDSQVAAAGVDYAN